jgi:uncharacterized protein YbjT (DUF2867 family)
MIDQQRRVLVTGAGGNVGAAVLARLRRAGVPARAAYHAAERAYAARAAGEDAVAIDMDHPATLRPALDGVATLFLLGAMSPRQTERELAVLDAALAAGVGRVVKLSVWRADEELTPIALLHRPVERAIGASGVAWTFLRPNFFMQNFAGAGAAAAIAGDGVLAQPASDAPIGFVDARDVGRAAAAVCADDGHAGAIYDLTGPEALTYAQAAEVFARGLGRPVRYVGLSDDDARAGMRQGGVPEFVIDALLGVGAAYRDGGADAVTPAIEQLTGEPPRTLVAFVADHRELFVEEGRARR